MAKIYKSLCSEIDSLYVKILNLSEQEIEYKLELEKLMNSGFVNIAKARYIMGSKSVSMLQLPTENSIQTTKALSRIHREDHKGYNFFKLRIIKPSSPSSDKSNESGAELVRRKGKTVAVDSNKKNELEDDENSGTNCEYSDPIKLFGVLVPFTLRTAQQFFKDSLFVTVKCATVQSELNSAIDRYTHLSKMKLLVHKRAVDKGLNILKMTDYNNLLSDSEDSDEKNVKT